MIRVMIIAKHPEVREGLRTVLGLAERFEISESVSCLEEAGQFESPDVAIIDLEMPGGEAFETIRRLKVRCPSTRIIALTAHDYPSARVTAIQAGASAVMVKGLPVSEMAAEIQDVG